MATKKEILQTLVHLGYRRQAQVIVDNWEEIRRTLRSNSRNHPRAVSECLMQGFGWHERWAENSTLRWAEVYNAIQQYEAE